MNHGDLVFKCRTMFRRESGERVELDCYAQMIEDVDQLKGRTFYEGDCLHYFADDGTEFKTDKWPIGIVCEATGVSVRRQPSADSACGSDPSRGFIAWQYLSRIVGNSRFCRIH